MIYSEEYVTRGEAMKREEWFKTRTGRKRVTEILAEKKIGGTGLSVTPPA